LKSSDPARTGDSAETGADARLWYRGIERYAWIVLIIAGLAWAFDSFNQNLFTLVRADSVADLLRSRVPAADLDSQVKLVGGYVTAVFMIGWAVGGLIFGMVGDRLGRVRTMMITVLVYAIGTGLNGLVHTIPEYMACRLLTAMGVGGEFAAGAALVAEVWPERSRAMASGTLQAISGAGNMGAALVVLALSHLSWRAVYFVGAAPALLLIWIQLYIHEPERWEKARREATAPAGSIPALFIDPELRRNTFIGLLLAIAGIGGLWGIAFFLPDVVTAILRPGLQAHHTATQVAALLKQYKSGAFFVQQSGAVCGMMVYAAMSNRMGRRPALAVAFVGGLVITNVSFWCMRDVASIFVLAFPLGFFASMPFSAYAVYFPELYPTRLRATGIGFCYNAARIVAAAAPFTLGTLASHFTRSDDPAWGYRVAVSCVGCVYVVGLLGLIAAPETRGLTLPE
jgi:MFS family permease